MFSRSKNSLDIPKPNLVPRKKIRAHTTSVLGKRVDFSKALSAGKSVGTGYLGYVHAAYENIMDMYGGDPFHFHIHGMRGIPRVNDCAREAENYVYRGLMATIAVAKAFGDFSREDMLCEFLAKYDSVNGQKPLSAADA